MARSNGGGRGFARLVLILAFVVGGGLILAVSVMRARTEVRMSRYGGSPAVEAVAPSISDGQVKVAQGGGPTAAARLNTTGAADTARPSGVPLKRRDWVLIRDYAAHGPAGNSQGAVDFGFAQDQSALGSEVIATHSGLVKLLRDDPTYGNLVYVIGPRWSTTYGQLQDFTVKEGDQVTRGQVIGHLGKSGDATRPHLDYQIWESGANRNPQDYCDCGLRGPDAPAQ